ncbi:hypothetical protein [Geminisphaera colitermitum]|uniref:hypothetical protein n=1 Tax=Geminisphaera colitermitum TaxID=1148786 RepID=UPI000158DB21|nr:hypothetical protein [Geminisphaera colitermitum]
MPAVLAVTAVVASVAGAGVSAYSSIQQGKATERLNNYNAALAQQEASVKERDSRIAANAQREQNAALLARQRALYAKSGVVGTTGTPLLVQSETAATLERSALDIERTGNIEAGRYRQQAVLDRMAGKSARRAGTLNAGATILGGVGSAASFGARYLANSGGDE